MSEEETNEETFDDSSEQESIKTHNLISTSLCGEVEFLGQGNCKVRLELTENMRVDDMGLVHGGFIFGGADHAAMVAVNERNVVLAASTCQFLAPAKVGDFVVFTAKVRHKDGRKRNVHVTGHVLDIKIFEAEFKTVVTERHVLKLNLVQEVENEL